MKRFAVGMGLALACFGQGASTKFEVASVKPCVPGGGQAGLSTSPGRLTANCASVMTLINFAYVLYADGALKLPGGRVVPIERAPTWVGPERFTIEAKAAGEASSGEMRGPMLRALLEDRFKLKIHTEMRDVPMYALTVAKSGAKLQPAQAGSCVVLELDRPPVPAGAGGGSPPPLCGLPRITKDVFEVRGVTMAELGSALRLDREVIDKTGIEGKYDIRVAVGAGLAGLLVGPALPPPPPGAGLGPAPPPPPPPDARSGEPGDFLSAAQAVVEKLGLRLESAKGPARFLVIDSVERPGEN